MLRALIQDEGQAVGMLAFADEKTFSTGSKGFHTQGKIQINGSKYQANLLLVKCGSKPAAKKKG